ncbi:proteasome assembly chaperone 4-like [Amphiura filiformis]|uniref:proteasome assembly chaperone 4-like n=1 Tax=Amphiura filiformis TaxID=82378 RepID=UPI003B212699
MNGKGEDCPLSAAAETSLSVTTTDTKLGVHNFTENILDQNVYFHVLKLEGSFYLWIGLKPARMDNLAVAMATRLDQVPCSSALLGDRTNLISTNLAQKLAKSTGKQVFISCSLPDNRMLLPLVEKRLHEELQTNPDKF